jgi:hypothetical protein
MPLHSFLNVVCNSDVERTISAPHHVAEPTLFVRHTAPGFQALFHLFVPSVLAARIAKLLRLQTVGVLLLIFRRRVVAVLALPALQRNGFPHILFS